MKSFRCIARRGAWLAIPTLTVAFWLWAIPPTIAQAREAPPVRYGPIDDGGSDEWEIQNPGYPRIAAKTSPAVENLNADGHSSRPASQGRLESPEFALSRFDRFMIFAAIRSLTIYRGISFDFARW